MHSDVNAAMNILARGGGKVPTRVRVLSFIPTASKVIAVNGKKSIAPLKGGVTWMARATTWATHPRY
jgi:transposase